MLSDIQNSTAMLSVQGYRKAFTKAAKRAGLPAGSSPNDLRHSAVSWAISLGADIYSMSNMVGHSRLSITLDVYGELWREQHDTLLDKMDEALGVETDLRPADAQVVAIR